MSNQNALPTITAKVIRFAPGHDQKLAANVWKLWTEGNEVYAVVRAMGQVAKISVHSSGQIHYRLGPKHMQQLAPLMRLFPGIWSHALEIRFLLSDGAKIPSDDEVAFSKKSVIVPIPKGLVLITNLIIGARTSAMSHPLPIVFGGAHVLWRSRLRDGRPVLLISRIAEPDEEKRNRVKFLREELKPTVTVAPNPVSSDTERKSPYVELFDLHWSNGGNVINVVPMGDEAVRFEEDDPSLPVDRDARTFPYSGPSASVHILAPDASKVATLRLEAFETEIELAKGKPSVHALGACKMTIDRNGLVAGSPFIAAPVKLTYLPKLGEAHPRTWEYLIFSKFDGFTFSAEVRPQSISFRNKNLPIPIEPLKDFEELLMVIPKETVSLSATLDTATASADIVGKFTLRDSR